MNIQELKTAHPRAFDKLFDKWREAQCQDEWWEFVFEQAYEDGKERGFYIDSAYKGQTHHLDICFSGFWSQGDGASWRGYVDVPKWLEWLRKTHAEKLERAAVAAGDTGTCFANGTPFTDQQLLWIDNGYLIDWLNSRVGICSSQSSYCHSMSMQLRDDGPWCDSSYEEDVPEGIFAGMNGDEFTAAFNEVVPNFLEEVLEAARGYADEIYKNLEAEYEYLMSEESFIEAMDGVEFDEEGEQL